MADTPLDLPAMPTQDVSICPEETAILFENKPHSPKNEAGEIGKTRVISSEDRRHSNEGERQRRSPEKEENGGDDKTDGGSEDVNKKETVAIEKESKDEEKLIEGVTEEKKITEDSKGDDVINNTRPFSSDTEITGSTDTKIIHVNKTSIIKGEERDGERATVANQEGSSSVIVSPPPAVPGSNNKEERRMAETESVADGGINRKKDIVSVEEAWINGVEVLRPQAGCSSRENIVCNDEGSIGKERSLVSLNDEEEEEGGEGVEPLFDKVLEDHEEKGIEVREKYGTCVHIHMYMYHSMYYCTCTYN